MTDDKAKAITCLALSAVGWLIFIGAILYDRYVPYSHGDFTPLINSAILGLSTIAAVVIHIGNCILGVIFFQKIEYKKTCLFGLSVSSSRVDSVKRYIAGQKEHHRTISFKEEFVEFLRKYNVTYDERYLWD